MINDLQNSDTWKIQLTVAINIISSKDVDKKFVIHARFTSYNDPNEIADELFESLRSRY